jgi:hypothetical protein
MFTNKDLRNAALHEAGHVVGGTSVGKQFYSCQVGIKGSATETDDLLATAIKAGVTDKKQLRIALDGDVTSLLSGPVAGSLFGNIPWDSPRNAADFKQLGNHCATAAKYGAITAAEIQGYLTSKRQQVTDLITREASAIKTLAGALEEYAKGQQPMAMDSVAINGWLALARPTENNGNNIALKKAGRPAYSHDDWDHMMFGRPTKAQAQLEKRNAADRQALISDKAQHERRIAADASLRAGDRASLQLAQDALLKATASNERIATALLARDAAIAIADGLRGIQIKPQVFVSVEAPPPPKASRTVVTKQDAKGRVLEYETYFDPDNDGSDKGTPDFTTELQE